MKLHLNVSEHVLGAQMSRSIPLLSDIKLSQQVALSNSCRNFKKICSKFVWLN